MRQLLCRVAIDICVFAGASRGLGLEFVRHSLAHHEGMIVATCRNPEMSAELEEFKNTYGSRLEVLALDVEKDDDIKRCAEKVQEIHGRADLLINNTGILHNVFRRILDFVMISSFEIKQVFELV